MVVEEHGGVIPEVVRRDWPNRENCHADHGAGLDANIRLHHAGFRQRERRVGEIQEETIRSPRGSEGSAFPSWYWPVWSPVDACPLMDCLKSR